MDQNFWYYTLSAIPQTLATTIALAATFIVYRLAHLNDYIKRDREFAQWFLQRFNPDKYTELLLKNEEGEISISFQTEANNLKENESRLGISKRFEYIQREYPLVVKDMYDIPETSANTTPEWMSQFIKSRARNFKENTARKTKIYRYLTLDLIFTVITIVLSLIFLPLYDWPLLNNLYQKVIIGIVVILSVFSISFTAFIVRRISKF